MKIADIFRKSNNSTEQEEHMVNCKSCGAPLVWIKTRAGKAMPCNAERIYYRKDPAGDLMLITPDGDTIRARAADIYQEGCDGYGHTSHFATCPAAGQYRKGRTV